MGILTPDQLTQAQARAAAELEASAMRGNLIALDVAKTLLAVTLARQMALADSAEQMRRERAYEEALRAARREARERFSSDEEIEEALESVPYPALADAVKVNIGEAVRIANLTTEALLRSRGLLA